MPAALMVAFALIGLAPESWRGGEVPGPRRTGGAAARHEPAGATRGAAIEAPGSATGVPEAGARPEQLPEIAWRGEPAQAVDEPTEPTPRLPSELAPVAPDIVVALPVPSDLPVVLAHAHGADGTQDEAGQITQKALPQAGDDFQGPEAGAFYW
ncbi:MAG: hypothetical protein ACREKB_05405, partial [Candidatus Rokuibacteriota bacterium]